MPAQWFVARTKTGREVTASVSVADKGYPVFLPMQQVRRTKPHSHSQTEQVSRPLFPRYLFVRFDPSRETHGEINSCRGIASRGLIVSVMDNPVSVPDEVIDAIRDRERVMMAIAGEIRTGYQPGDTFEIQRGHGTVTATYMGEERGKVMAIVEMFGRGHIVALDFAEVPQNLDNRAA